MSELLQLLMLREAIASCRIEGSTATLSDVLIHTMRQEEALRRSASAAKRAATVERPKAEGHPDDERSAR